jgi:hypothetical protein
MLDLNSAVTESCYACEKCHKQFSSTKPAKYCSPACKQSAYRDRHKPVEPTNSPGDEDAFLQQLVNETISRCEQEGVNPKDLLLYLKRVELENLLDKCSKQQCDQFLMHLIDRYWSKHQVR